jgi:hypothetical protein
LTDLTSFLLPVSSYRPSYDFNLFSSFPFILLLHQCR